MKDQIREQLINFVFVWSPWLIIIGFVIAGLWVFFKSFTSTKKGGDWSNK